MEEQKTSYTILMANLSKLDFRKQRMESLLEKIHDLETRENVKNIPDEELALENGLRIYKYYQEQQQSTEEIPYYLGLQTNEYSAKVVLSENKAIDCLLLIVTDAVRGMVINGMENQPGNGWSLEELIENMKEGGAEDSESTLYYYLRELQAFCGLDSGRRIGKVILLPVSDSPKSEDMTTTTIRCANIITEREKAHGDNDANSVHLYLDTNGGLRDFMTVLIATMRLVRSSGINVEKAYYAAFQRGKYAMPIIDKKDTYEVFDLVSGNDEFISHGKVTGLRHYFGTDQPVLTAVEEFSIAAQYCDPDGMIEGISKISNAIDNWTNSRSNRNNEMQFYIVCRIRDDFGEELMNISDTLNKDDLTQQCLIPLIRWCAGKQMIQQAATLYSEKMPEVIVKSKLLYYRIYRHEGISSDVAWIRRRKFNHNSFAFVFIQNYLNLAGNADIPCYRRRIHFQEDLNKNEVFADDNIKNLVQRGLSETEEAKRLLTNIHEEEKKIKTIANVLKDYYDIKGIRNCFCHADGASFPSDFRDTEQEPNKSSIYFKTKLNKIQEAIDLCK